MFICLLANLISFARISQRLIINSSTIHYNILFSVRGLSMPSLQSADDPKRHKFCTRSSQISPSDRPHEHHTDIMLHDGRPVMCEPLTRTELVSLSWMALAQGRLRTRDVTPTSWSPQYQCLSIKRKSRQRAPEQHDVVMSIRS